MIVCSHNVSEDTAGLAIRVSGCYVSSNSRLPTADVWRHFSSPDTCFQTSCVDIHPLQDPQTAINNYASATAGAH